MSPLQRPARPGYVSGSLSRMQAGRTLESTAHLDTLCTPERQSLCESHRQRRWLTYWSYIQVTSYISFRYVIYRNINLSELVDGLSWSIHRGIRLYEDLLFARD